MEPFKTGDTVKCRDVGAHTALVLGGDYKVKACAKIGQAYMVQVVGPAGFNLAGEQMWYSARRFVLALKGLAG